MNKTRLKIAAIRMTATLLLLLTTALCAQGKDFKYTTVTGDPMHTRIYTLDNGLTVYLTVNHETPRVQTYIAVRTGSRNDPKETTGLAHYLEHIMFKGTKSFGTSDYNAEKPLLDDIEQRFETYRTLTDPAERKAFYHGIDSVSQLAAKYNIPNEYDKLMAAIGSEGSNAYTSNDVTCYIEDVPNNEIENWAKVQADRFQNMVVRGFHTELEAVYEEFNMGLTDDGNKEWNALNKKLFPTHPYGTQTTIGTQDHLKNPSIRNIKQYFNRYYVPNNIAICLSGDIDPEETMNIINKYFGSWQRNAALSRPEYAPVQELSAPTDTTVTGLEAENVLIGWRYKGYADFQKDTLDVISDMLFNGKAGLFDLNLSQPMKVQEAQAFCESMHDYGEFIAIGVPKEGQSLEEVRALILQEIAKIKVGDFPDDLLPAVINNKKRQFYLDLQSNKKRADMFVKAFIGGQKWEDKVNTLNRMAGMTKQQIVDFAKNYFKNNYVTVFKRQGNDASVQKIEKPVITPLPTNNDKQSPFLQAVVGHEAKPIAPRFLDFSRDLVRDKVTGNGELLYKQNTEDDLFELDLEFPMGTENDKSLAVAARLFDYAATNKRSAQAIQRAFYSLACDYSIDVNERTTRFVLKGLNANFPKALALFAELLNQGTLSKEAYRQAVDLILKEREDEKASQKANYSALCDYGMYGDFNPTRNIMSAEELENSSPETLMRRLSDLRNAPDMTIMYYGPSSMNELKALVAAAYPAQKRVYTPAKSSLRYTRQAIDKTEIWLAPYEAKNIYMLQYHNDDRAWKPENAPINALFNAYFGGGMNAIVFQELREARGLAYSAGARYLEPKRRQDSECFYTFIITQTDKMMDCIKEFNNLLNNMPQRQAGVDLAKQSIMKSLASKRVNRFAVLNAYLQAKKLGIDYDIDAKVYQELPKLTLSDLADFAKARIEGQPFRYLILGDEHSLDLKSLEKLGPIKRVSTSTIFGY